MKLDKFEKKIILFQVMAMVLSIPIGFIIQNRHYYSLIYPKLIRGINTTIIIVFFSIVISISIIIRKRIKVSGFKIDFNLYLRFAILFVFIILLFSQLQYRLYLSKPESFEITNTTIKEYHIKKEIEVFDKNITDLQTEIYVANKLASIIGDSILITSRFNLNHWFKKDFPGSGYNYSVDSFNIYFSADMDDATPPPPPNGVTMFIIEEINFVSKDFRIEIDKTPSNKIYFESLNNNFDTINSYDISSIINIFITENKDKINRYRDNILIVQNRGLPMATFIFDALKPFFGGSQEYKPLSWIGQIIQTFQNVITFLILPLIVAALIDMTKSKFKSSKS